MFSRIVVAYDDSPQARRALERAIGLARNHGTQLITVVVEAHPPHHAATMGEVEEEMVVEEQAFRPWLAAARAFADEYSVQVTVEIRAGPAAQELVRAAEKVHADLIVLARRGRRVPWVPHLRSTAQQVSRRAPCPVLIVP
ncbi:universal stress protein [Actinacidiphila oryziradicis]|uniref:Universal stress protein n=1 Tax=Actinacidiphila oryziradicis TaxID=2571141 RepID=A0A4V6WIT6_9ACTN|nr:universal stress protein [Actinacidiphila oryziradicis]